MESGRPCLPTPVPATPPLTARPVAWIKHVGRGAGVENSRQSWRKRTPADPEAPTSLLRTQGRTENGLAEGPEPSTPLLSLSSWNCAHGTTLETTWVLGTYLHPPAPAPTLPQNLWLYQGSRRKEAGKKRRESLMPHYWHPLLGMRVRCSRPCCCGSTCSWQDPWVRRPSWGRSCDPARLCQPCGQSRSISPSISGRAMHRALCVPTETPSSVSSPPRPGWSQGRLNAPSLPVRAAPPACPDPSSWLLLSLTLTSSVALPCPPRKIAVLSLPRPRPQPRSSPRSSLKFWFSPSDASCILHLSLIMCLLYHKLH